MTYETIFRHKGRKCRIAFIADSIQGHWVGYCKTTLQTEPHRLDYDIDVHGGITWGPDSDGWIGFDCIHAGDENVGPNGEVGANPPEDGIIRQTWREESVRDETKRLAEQLDEIE